MGVVYSSVAEDWHGKPDTELRRYVHGCHVTVWCSSILCYKQPECQKKNACEVFEALNHKVLSGSTKELPTLV